MATAFGIDEAGKGPALGSMFAAAVVADPADLPAGVGDSKAIAPARRQTLAAQIRDCATAVAVAEIPVDRIDDPATDMNSLTVAAHADALAQVLERLETGPVDHPIGGYVDAGETDADRFGRRVTEHVDTPIEVVAEHRADETRPLVGAASIVAKVTRDEHMAALATAYDDRYGELGSGYPSDPATRSFLRSYVDEHGDLPPCARASWRTCRDVLGEAAQTSVGDF